MQRFIQFSLQSSAIGVGETKWVRNGFGRPEGTGSELGWDQIRRRRKSLVAQERRRRKSLVAAANRVKQGSVGAPGGRSFAWKGCS